MTCKDPSSPKCLKPDTSEASCLQGGGACAYESGQTSPLVYKASLRGAQAARPSASNNMTGLVSVTLHNTTYGSGYLFATNVVQMTQAFFWFDQGGQKFPLVWVFNGTYGPVSGSIKVSFTFNPSVNKVSLLLASGLVYFDVNTAAHTTGGLGVQLAGPSFKVYTNGTAGLQFGSAAPILGGVAHTTGGLGF